MSADPNPVDRLEQAATQFKNRGVIQLAVQGLLLEGVARDLRRCDAATVGCVELSAWLNRGIRELVRRKRIVDAQIRIIGTRHGEKLHETLLSREEMVKSEDEGDYFRVPLDSRSLQYELYFDEGQTTISRNDDYTSENTYRLNVEETKRLLMRLPEMQKLVGANQR